MKVRYSKSGIGVKCNRKFTLNGVEIAGTRDSSLKTDVLKIADERLIEDNIIEITDNEF